MVGGRDTAAQSAVVDPVIRAVGATVSADPCEPSVPSKPDIAENFGSVASGEESSAAAGTTPDISNQAADSVVPVGPNHKKLSAAVRTLPDIRNQEESQEDREGLLASFEEEEGVSPLDSMRGLSKSVEDIQLWSNLRKD